MALAQRFEELEIWQAARVFAGAIYRISGPGSAADRDFAFVNQIRSAAVSGSNNIAEGFECDSAKEFQRFLTIARRSSGEVRSMLWLAQDFAYLDGARAGELRQQAEVLSRRIAAFSRSLDP